MSFIGGYQSDVNLNDLQFVGDFPIEHSIGGFGIAQGTDNYTLSLTPAISQYRQGLPLEVKFQNTNTGPATLNVDTQGAVPVKKIEAGALTDLTAGELDPDKLYILIHDGAVFQIANHGASVIVPLADESQPGISERATQAETNAGTDDARHITPLKLLTFINNFLATETQAGISERATQAETNAGADDTRHITPLKLLTFISNFLATEIQAGISERATQSETNAGTDDARHITPLKLFQFFINKLATELQAGTALIASQADVNTGTDDTKIVTPAKLAAYVSDKLTGLWEDKGVLDCSTNPNYPASQKGDAYTVSAAGKIGGASGADVQVRDVIYCVNDNPGGDQATVGGDWNIIQTNLVQATELVAGFAEIATQGEVNAGTDNTRIVTALKLKTLLDNRVATELITGLAELATQAEVNAGTDDSRIVTSLKLKTLLDNRLATEILAGLAEIATQTEVNAGTDDSRIVTALKLKTLLDNRTATEIRTGLAEIATQAEVDAGTDDERIVTPIKLFKLLDVLLQYAAGTGTNAIIPKDGTANEASGTDSAVLNGRDNRSATAYSSSVGRGTDANRYAEFASAGGMFFSTRGSAQFFKLQAFTTVNPGTGIFPINLDGSGLNNTNRWSIPSNTVHTFRLYFQVVQNSGTTGNIGDTWSAYYEGVARNNAGTLNWVGSSPTANNVRSDAGFTPSVGFVFQGDKVVPFVIAMSGRVLHVNITCLITQTKFNLS
ncbi:MAG: hypothetical protein H6585_10200 [Flavobacteriales bacterium]|nr:hypothetical protein [Flavobacteriales bacterium]